MANSSSSRLRVCEPTAQSSRILHVGLPKTGTTAIQEALRSSRETLAQYGVLYPGTGRNHKSAFAAMYAHSDGAHSRPPSKDDWQAVVDEIATNKPKRALISYELVGGATPGEIDDIVGSLRATGPVHVVITARDVSRVYASAWQQYVKSHYARSFDDWVGEAIVPGPGGDAPVSTPSFRPRHDLADVIGRWSAVVGGSNLTVVALDPAQPSALFAAFEDLLDVPQGVLLDRAASSGDRLNRTLTAMEAEFVRLVNARLPEGSVPPLAYLTLVNGGMVAAVQRDREVPTGEAHLRLSGSAREAAIRDADRALEAIRRGGVRLVGDESLLRPVADPSGSDVERVHDLAELPTDLVVLAARGLLSSAIKAGVNFDRPRRKRGVPLPERRGEEADGDGGDRGDGSQSSVDAELPVLTPPRRAFFFAPRPSIWLALTDTGTEAAHHASGRRRATSTVLRWNPDDDAGAAARFAHGLPSRAVIKIPVPPVRDIVVAAWQEAVLAGETLPLVPWAERALDKVERHRFIAKEEEARRVPDDDDVAHLALRALIPPLATYARAARAWSLALDSRRVRLVGVGANATTRLGAQVTAIVSALAVSLDGLFVDPRDFRALVAEPAVVSARRALRDGHDDRVRLPDELSERITRQRELLETLLTTWGLRHDQLVEGDVSRSSPVVTMVRAPCGADLLAEMVLAATGPATSSPAGPVGTWVLPVRWST